jgi:hypothetical protein
LLNGVPAANVCGTAASSYSGRFLHIEQDPGFRTPSDWVQAVEDTWPTGPPAPPAAPSGLSAMGGNAQVSLTWNASSGADTYNVYRATVRGGPYSPLVSGLTQTAHLDTTVTNGTTYFYVVSALNEGGESGRSAQASATPLAPAYLRRRQASPPYLGRSASRCRGTRRRVPRAIASSAAPRAGDHTPLSQRRAPRRTTIRA